MSSKSLEQENLALRRTIRVITNKAEQNQAALQSLFALELKLLSCDQLSELITLILQEFRLHFRLTCVDMILFDPEYAARHLLDDFELPEGNCSLSFVENQQLLKELFPRGQIQIGKIEDNLLSLAFPNQTQVNSSALLPLIRQGCLIGTIHFGSADAERYKEGFKYDYISHLASVISVCIENCISRENLRSLSMKDVLTKVYNRGSFDQEIVRELSRANRENYPLSCLFLDLDHFKQVNDTFGHQTGDHVLRATGLLLKNSLRKSDVIARYGGEEFAILLPECDSLQALKIAEQVRDKVQQQIFRSVKGQPFRMSTSIGVSTCTPSKLEGWQLSDIASALVDAADRAVYESKYGGRNRVSTAAFPDHPTNNQQTA